MDIFKTNGIKLTSIADGTVDSLASPLSLPSRNVSGYGKILNENLVKLLENFADVTPPTNGIVGQLWFDVDDNQLYINSTTGYRPLSVTYKTVSDPENPSIGDIWWDAGKKQLKVFDGGNWIVAGPDYENSWGETGWFSTMTRDTQNIDHLITRLKIGGQDKVIINQDAEFTPSQPIDGFSVLKTGVNVSSRVPDFLYNAKADDSNKLGGALASLYLRIDRDSEIDGRLTVKSLEIGETTLSVSLPDNNLIVANQAPNSSINFDLLIDNVMTTVLSLDEYGQVLLSMDPLNPRSATNKSYVDGKFNENREYIDSKFNEDGILPIEIGGTGATTIEQARANLRVPSNSGTGANGRWSIDISGMSENSRRLNEFVESTSPLPDTIARRDSAGDLRAVEFIGTATNSRRLNEFAETTVPLPDTIARRDSSGDLSAVEFIGIATRARYADLAEKYLTDREYDTGTVVMVGGDQEMTACVPGSRAIGAISANPAYMMNSGLEGGQYVALKGRLQIKIVGPVKKGDMLIAADNGCAKIAKSTGDHGIFAVALGNSDNTEAKLIECLIL